jgi:molecular chaperone HtpG
MVNSLYSHREIFLRELISNSCDALDKLRFEELTSPEIAVADKHIRIRGDKEQKTLQIIDNGIGMSFDEVSKNIGTIAYSGTKNFLKNAQKMKEQPELIGQFGVGFYSSFMIADKVEILTKKAGSSEATLWESSGDGNYTIDQVTSDTAPGTIITLYLKDLSKEENAQDFADEWTLRSIVKKYSDFVSYPIRMLTTKEESEKDKDGKVIEGKTKKVTEDEVLNSQKALWLRNAKEIDKKEYLDFYKHVTSDWADPLETIHYKAEGTQEFSSLLYIPSTVPFDYNQRDMKFGLNLYVKRVFITANCEELIPQYLRFMKGIVDSNDLPLNISRELIQKDRQINLISKAVVSKVLRQLKTMKEKNNETYLKFWDKFGATLKEGVASDHSNKEAIIDLLLFKSTNSDKLTTLKDYVSRMQKSQKDIYYISGESFDHISVSPYLEKLKKKNLEVLFLTDPVDEWVVSSIPEYEKKKLVSITSEKLDLDTEEERKEKEEERKEQTSKFKGLCENIKKALEEQVKDVKLTDRLVDSPVCLVSGENDPSAYMEQMMEKMGQAMPKAKRILEINPDHKIYSKMLSFPENKQKAWAQILYNQALLNEGSPIKDPRKFSEQISNLMLGA